MFKMNNLKKMWQNGLISISCPIFFVIIYLLFFANKVQAQPVITGISTNIVNHKDSIIITGTGFGTKNPTTPFRSSYMHPDTAQNFQESGSFNTSYWSTPLNYYGNNFVSLQNSITRTNVNSQRDYVMMEYKNEGTGSGVRVYNLPMTGKNYFAWWDYFETGFNPANMHTGCASFKYIYLNAGGHPHMAIQMMQDGKFYGSASGGVGGQTAAQQDSNLILPFGGGFYGRPISWVVNYILPIGEWYFAELIYNINSSPGIHDGWVEFRINNEILWRANNIDIFDPGYTNDPGFEDIAFGGNYGWDGGNDTYYRYYGDIYIDNSFARVTIGNSENYDNCSHLELQISTAWSDSSIAININQGSFSNTETAYLFVVDADGNVSNACQIDFSGTGLKRDENLSNNFVLQQNYPNPFNPFTTIKYSVIKPCNIQIKIYNQLGQEVHELVNEHKPAGEYNITWDGKDAKGNKVASGVYFYRFAAGKQVKTKKMLYLR